MKLPWFFATTPAPRPALPERRTPLATWLRRVAQRYVDWAVHSHEQLRGSRSLG